MADPEIPPEAGPDELYVKDKGVFGPGGRFATLYQSGMYNYGETRIAPFLEANPTLFPDVSASLLRIMRAVSDNEGKLEAINSYDNAFLSIGIFQWTAGTEAGAGELADVLHRLETSYPAAFKTYFGDNGLSLAMGKEKAGSLRTGYLVLDGTKLDTVSRKAVLRQPIWNYRFWRASHDTDVRACQIAQAMARIEVFYRVAQKALKGLAIADYVSSEAGVAQLLDQHVNRPGHVPGTLVKAIDAYVADTKKADPKSWTSADERLVIDRYLCERTKTSMTDSQKRAESIKAAVDAGRLSNERGSFTS